MKWSVFAVVALATGLSGLATAQDKALEALCGDLFGARQTAIRLRDGGFPLQVAVNETMARSEWRTASMQNQTLALRVVQEVYTAPGLPSSEVIRGVCQRAVDAPKPQ
jgi:hypothetical protein